MAVSVPIQKNVYYLGEMEYNKKWVLDTAKENNIQGKDVEKMMLLSLVKQAFDSQIYIGPRCNSEDTACVTKGKCPVNKKLSIILMGRSDMETEEKGWRSIIIHAYKTGDLEEAVFDKHIAASGNPIKIKFNLEAVVKGSEDQSAQQDMLKGEFIEVEDAAMITDMKDLMKTALTDACKADVMALQSEDYEEQKEQ